jgi:hypothetical protein
MAGMATWRDGPEYAPAERPDAFVEPYADALPAPAPTAAVPDGLPGVEPSFAPPEQAAPDLAALVPAAAPGRDPHRAFEVVSSALTPAGPSLTAWGAAHTATTAFPPPTGAPVVAAPPAWSPQQPIPAATPAAHAWGPPPPAVAAPSQVNPQAFPPPTGPGWYAPPPSPAGQQPPQVTLSQVWRAATPAVIITLAVGALLQLFSVLMLVLSYALATRVAHRRSLVRGCYLIAIGLVAGGGLLAAVVNDFDLDLALQAGAVLAQLCCWVLPFVVCLIQAVALSRGDRPDA